MDRAKKTKRWLAAIAIVLLSIFCLIAQTQAIEDANWRSVLQYFQDSFRSAGESLKDFNSQLDDRSWQFQRDLAKIEKSRDQLMLLYGVGQDPDDLRVIHHGLTVLGAEADSRFKWFSDAEHSLEISASKVGDLKSELQSQIATPSSATFLAPLKRDLKDISTLESQLVLIRSKMEKSREAYNVFMARLQEAQKATRLKTKTYWKIYFLRNMPGLFSEDFLKDFKSGPQKWLTEGNLWWEIVSSDEQVTQNRQLLLKVLSSVFLLALLGAILQRKLKKSFFPAVKTGGLFTFWIFLCLWASIRCFGENATFEISGLVMIIGEAAFSFVLLYGFILLHKRAAALDKASSKGVYPLWILNLLQLQLRGLNLPYSISLTTWILCLGICCIYMYFKRQTIACGLQRYLYIAAIYLPCTLMAIAALGYLPLSFLIVSTVVYGWLSIDISINLLKSLRGFVKTKRKQDHFLIGILSIMGFPLIIIMTVFINLKLFSLHLGGSEVFHRIISAELGWDSYRLNLKILCLIILGFYTTRVLALLVESLALRAAHLDPGITEVVQKTSKYLFWGFFLLATLSLLGFNLMSLTVVAGGLSVGIGFGLQQIVNNFFSGLILLLGRSVQPGDTIQINETLGDVKKITIRNTVVQTRDNATLFIPNSELITTKIVNWSHRDRRVRLNLTVGVAYGSDTKMVRSLLLQSAREVAGVLVAPAPEVLFANFAASTLDFQLRFWIADMDQDVRILSRVRYEIDRLFRENNIEIAFPQSTLHIQSAPALEKLFGKTAETL
ncbi:MAG: mechanosensitive ion channel family protein [Syntrophobacteraceae bacterium]